MVHSPNFYHTNIFFSIVTKATHIQSPLEAVWKDTQQHKCQPQEEGKDHCLGEAAYENFAGLMANVYIFYWVRD